MTVTAASFRAAFPAFNDPAKYPQGEIDFWILVATQRHNADRWGEMLDTGVMLFVAHNVSLEFNARQAAAAGQGAGQVVGALTSVSAKGVSWSRDAGSAAKPEDGHWNLTSYGMRWREMVNLVGAGPLHVGVPSAVEVMASDMAWPGFVYPPY